MSRNKRALYPFFKPHDGTKNVYISGGMSGYPDDNAPSFEIAEAALQALGYAVCSPVRTSEWLGDLSHADYLRFDFERVLEADFLVALPGWETSLGALAEILVATRIGTKVWRWENFSNYDLVTYADVEAAISAMHRGESKPTTVFVDRLVTTVEPETGYNDEASDWLRRSFP